jgi:hypothetical protein
MAYPITQDLTVVLTSYDSRAKSGPCLHAWMTEASDAGAIQVVASAPDSENASLGTQGVDPTNDKTYWGVILKKSYPSWTQAPYTCTQVSATYWDGVMPLEQAATGGAALPASVTDPYSDWTAAWDAAKDTAAHAGDVAAGVGKAIGSTAQGFLGGLFSGLEGTIVTVGVVGGGALWLYTRAKRRRAAPPA